MTLYQHAYSYDARDVTSQGLGREGFIEGFGNLSFFRLCPRRFRAVLLKKKGCQQASTVTLDGFFTFSSMLRYTSLLLY